MLYNEIKDNFNLKEPGQFINENSQFNLLYNYRSAQEIVNYSNNIQFFRKIMFPAQVKPQGAWFEEEDGEYPNLFILGDNISENEFIEYADDTVIIIPDTFGNMDKINERVKEDTILCKLCEHESQVSIEDNIMDIFTSLTAKGLEFNKVVIYKFGDYLEKDLLKYLKENNYNEIIKIEYFINRLYVAITRAKKQLIIVDTEKGNAFLWKHFGDNSLKEMNEEEHCIWQEHLGVALKGQSLEIIRENDPLRNARQLKEKGIFDENSSLLKRAKNLFKKHGTDQESILCEAWYYKLEGKLKRAGELFLQLKQDGEALHCYWMGEHWLAIKEMYEKNKGAMDIRYKLIANYMLIDGNTNPIEKINAGKKLLFNENNAMQDELLESKQYQKIEEQYFNTLQRKASDLPKELQQEIAGLIDEHNDAFQKDFNAVNQLIFDLYYLSGEYKKAIEVTEENNLEQGLPYYRANLACSNYPETITYHYILRDYDQVVNEYEENNCELDTEEQLTKVAESYLEKEDLIKCVDIYFILNNGIRVEEIFKENVDYFNNHLNDNFEWFFGNLFDLMLQEKRLGDLLFGIINKFYKKEKARKIKLFQILFSSIASADYELGMDLSFHQRDIFFENTKQLVLNQKKYRLNIIEVSLAYEKIGVKYKDLLSYYESLLEIIDLIRHHNYKEYDDQLRDIYGKCVGMEHFLRTRWLYSKKRFIEINENMPDKKVLKHQEEINTKIKEWNLTANDIPNKTPNLKKTQQQYIEPEDIAEETVTLKNDSSFKNENIYGELKLKAHNMNDKVIDTLTINFDRIDAADLTKIIIETKRGQMEILF